ncbi:MAG: hypothetical protein OHK006_00020 [Thermodesulfovibrionales bacterium]
MNRKALTSVIVLFGALVLFPAPSAEGRERTTRTRPASVKDFDSRRLAETIHGLVNKERGRKGQRPLVWDEWLFTIAANYSRDMAERRFFSHADPDGRTFTDRYRDDGYECKVKQGNVTSLGGENIAQTGLYRSAVTRGGKTSYNWLAEEEIAAAVVKLWMNSKGHRQNILTPYFRKQGIGVFITPDRKVYVTQNFC